MPEKVKGRNIWHTMEVLIKILPAILERSQAVKDLEAFKSQSEGIAREYDRLSEEHSKIEKKLAILEGEGGPDKKDD